MEPSMTREFKTITLLYIVKITFNAITHWSTLNILLVAPGKKKQNKKTVLKKALRTKNSVNVATTCGHNVITMK